MATFRKRGDYQWQAQVRLRGHTPESKTFHTKADAEKWAKAIETDMGRGVFVSSKEAENTTLAECLLRYKADCETEIDGKSLSGLKKPRADAQRAGQLACESFAKKFMANVRGTDIAAYVRERMLAGRKANTILHEIYLISKIFKVAKYDWGMVSLQNPVKDISKPKPTKRERRLEEGEEEKLLACCSPNFEPVILWALETCMRREEIAVLRWANVNLEAHTAFLPETKNSEARTVPLSKKAMDILQKKTRNIGGLVFGQGPDRLSHKMRETVIRGGLADLHFHDLRHEAISRLVENTDLDMLEIKKITGHKTLAQLDKYTHLRTAQLVARLDGARRGEG